MLFAILDILSIKDFINLFDYGRQAGLSMMFIGCLCAILICPFDCMYRTFRMEFLHSFAHNIIAPFGLVRFKEFFLGDILTSLAKPLIDLYFVTCFFASDSWKHDDHLNECILTIKLINKKLLNLNILQWMGVCYVIYTFSHKILAMHQQILCDRAVVSSFIKCRKGAIGSCTDRDNLGFRPTQKCLYYKAHRNSESQVLVREYFERFDVNPYKRLITSRNQFNGQKSSSSSNAGKYFSTILVLVIAYFKNKYNAYKQLYFLMYLFSTIYSYVWDLTMDWGLIRGTKPDNKLLRDKLKYPHCYYYFSMITNLFLRFAWLLTFLPQSYFSPFFYDNGGLVIILTLAEAYRRAQWSLFRVENENVNNFEKYRVILEIPNLQEFDDTDLNKSQFA